MCKHWWSYPMSVILFKTIVLKWIRSHLGRRGAHKSIFSFNVNDFCKMFFFLIFETHPYMYISYSRKILLKTLREKNKQTNKKIKTLRDRTYLVVQWLRLCLPWQGMWVQTLVWELGSHVPHAKTLKHKTETILQQIQWKFRKWSTFKKKNFF